MVHSEGHPDYPRALGELPAWTSANQTTSSEEARTASSPLFAANRLNLEPRHNSASHERETIAFSNGRQSVLERTALALLWHDFVKPFSEHHGGGTPDTCLGLRERPQTLRSLLAEWLLPERVQLPESWRTCYFREIVTRRIPSNRRHTLTHAP